MALNGIKQKRTKLNSTKAESQQTTVLITAKERTSKIYDIKHNSNVLSYSPGQHGIQSPKLVLPVELL